MSIAEQITRINNEKKRIAAKTTEFGLTDNDTVNLQTLADAIEGIEYHACVDVTITQDGEPFEIVPGYHKGGFIYAVDNPEADKPKYLLESGRVVTPLKNADQTIVKGEGYYGLGAVVVKKIPDAYQDVTPVDATESDVLANKKIVAKDGTVVVGKMPNNGEWGALLDLSKPQVQIPQGYHDGEGVVTISTHPEHEVTPDKEEHTIAPATGRVLSTVKVLPIPDEYQDVSGVTAHPLDVLEGYWYVRNDGELVEGEMTKYTQWSGKLHLGLPSVEIPTGYHSSSTVSLNMQPFVEVTPNEGTQTITPDDDKVLSVVKVNPIPSKYKDLTKQTVTAADVLNTAKFVAKDGTLTDGTIPNLGVIEGYVDTLNDTGWSLGESGYVRAVSFVLDNSNLIKELQKI